MVCVRYVLETIDVRSSVTVDRVRRQQQAERDATRGLQPVGDTKQIHGNNAVSTPQQELPMPAEHKGSPPNKAGGGIFSNLRQKFKPSLPPSKHSPPLQPMQLDNPPLPPPKLTTNDVPETRGPMRPYSKQGSEWNSDLEVTPHVNIEHNVRAAIDVPLTLIPHDCLGLTRLMTRDAKLSETLWCVLKHR